MQQHNASGPADPLGRAAQNVRYGSVDASKLGPPPIPDKPAEGPTSDRRHDADYPAGVPADVANLFEKFAFEVIDSGKQKYSARAILHRARWHAAIEQGGRDFKLNNNWSAGLSRWFMRKHPQHAGFFETRERHPEHEGRKDAA